MINGLTNKTKIPLINSTARRRDKVREKMEEEEEEETREQEGRGRGGEDKGGAKGLRCRRA